jgi:hypothetical protein
MKRKKDFVLRKGKQKMGKNVYEKISTKERGEKYVKDKQRGREKGSGKIKKKEYGMRILRKRHHRKDGGKRENEK